MVFDVWLKLQDIFLRKYVGNDLALARVCDTISGVEQASRDGDECVVKVGLQRTAAVPVNDLQSRRIGNGEVVRRDANKCSLGSGLLDVRLLQAIDTFVELTILLVHLMDNF